MNNPPSGSAGLGQTTPISQNNEYSSDNVWTTISPYNQSPYSVSPMNDYSSFGYMNTNLPAESLNRMPPPPAPHNQQQHQHHHHHHHQNIQPAPAPSPMGHHQLPMLNTTWPSQLTNPSHPSHSSGSYSAPPLSSTPMASLPNSEPPRSQLHQDKARKTLSLEQKRAMCTYHEENPGTRQADIGLKFGVERSTVSKVLRHREQYLKRDPESEHAAIKRGKGKHPDFDRTLGNYVRRQQQRGLAVNDDELMEQAKLFAHASGNQEGLLGTLTSSWLQKFKQKHGLVTGKLMRRASEANIPDSARMTAGFQPLKHDRSAGVISPTSPKGPLSPLSGTRSDDDFQPTEGLGLDFSYRPIASQSTTSLSSDIRDAGSASLPRATISPTTSYQFTPDANTDAFQIDENSHMRGIAPPFEPRERRSNTFPSLNLEYINSSPITIDSSGSRNVPPLTATSSTFESPASTKFTSIPYTIQTALQSPPTLKRSSSSSSIMGRSNATTLANNPVPLTPVDTTPVSPSQEEARQAANTLLNYIQNMSSAGHFDQTEYMAVVQLTKKLQIHQHHTARPSMGGLSRIPEGDAEVPVTQQLVMTSSAR